MTDHDELIRQVRDRAERLPIETPSPRSAMDKGRRRRRFSLTVSAMAALIIAIGVAVPLRALMRLGEDAPTRPIQPSPSGAASFPEPTGTIAFIGGGFGPITLLDVASGTTEPLTKQSYGSVSVAWSPDGSLIAMARAVSEGNGELVLFSTKTGELTETMPIDPLLHPGDVDWSPNGTTLAFTDTLGRLHTIESDGSHLEEVATDGRALDIAFSPSGGQIAFVGDKGGLSVVDLDTGATSIVFSDPAKQRVWFGPTWSPDGSMLAFSMTEEGGSSINVVNVDGSGFRQVLDPSHEGVAPTWSPDGNWIAFEGGGQRRDLFAVTTDGVTVRQLTDSGLGEFGSDWGAIPSGLSGSSDVTALVSSSGPSSDTALLIGTLTAENGCLAVSTGNGSSVYVVWPAGYSLSEEKGGTWLVDHSGALVATIGDEVQMGGGITNLANAEPEVVGGIPSSCEVGGTDAYWFAGTPVAVIGSLVTNGAASTEATRLPGIDAYRAPTISVA